MGTSGSPNLIIHVYVVWLSLASKDYYSKDVLLPANAGQSVSLDRKVGMRFFDKDDSSREVFGAATDGASQVIVQVTNLPPLALANPDDIQLIGYSDTLWTDKRVNAGVFTQTLTAPPTDFWYLIRKDSGWRELTSPLKTFLGISFRGRKMTRVGEQVWYDFYLFKPPVLLIHGLWDDSDSFTAMRNYLLSHYGTDVYSMDYSKANARSLNENKDLVGKESNKYLTNVRRGQNGLGRPIVVKKVDVVAHSMGGLLANVYIVASNYRTDINRLITIGTPYSGSHLANYVLYFLFRRTEMPYEQLMWWLTVLGVFGHSVVAGAVEDLQVGSAAIAKLSADFASTSYSVPSMAIAGTRRDDSAGLILSLVYEFLQRWDASYFGGVLFAWRGTAGATSNTIFRTAASDYVVSVDSQSGGRASSLIMGVEDHVGEPRDADVVSLVYGTLDSTPVAKLEKGFAPIALTPPLEPIKREEIERRLGHMEGGQAARASDILAPDTGGESAISIVSPEAGAVYEPGSKIRVEARSDGEVSGMLFVTAKGWYITESPPYTWEFTVDENWAGQLPIAVAGLGGNGLRGIGTTHIMVEASGPPESMEIGPFNPLVLNPTDESPTYVKARYLNGKVIDVTRAPNTRYASADPVIVTVNAEGVVHAVSVGRTKISVDNHGTGAALEVIVEKAPETFTLNVTKSGTGSGILTSSPAGIACGSTCSSAFDDGTSVALVATPAAGSAFTGWSGEGCTGIGTCTVIMTQARNVTATFTAETTTPTLTVTKAGSGSGTVTSSPPGLTCGTGSSVCAASFTSGIVVTLAATPASGSTFTGWGGEGCSGTGTCTVTMSADRSVTATFTGQATLTVTTRGSAGGTLTSNPAGINCGSTCSASYTSGTSVTLTVTPDSGASFKAWSGACSGVASTCTVTLDASKNVVATFSKVLTDDPLAARVSPIKAVHFTELMDAINRLRSLTGLAAFAWSRSTPTSGGTVLKEHVTDLRTALTQAYQAAGRATPTYAEPIVSRETTIKASHLSELRTLVRAME